MSYLIRGMNHQVGYFMFFTSLYPLVNTQKATLKPWPSRNSGWIPMKIAWWIFPYKSPFPNGFPMVFPLIAWWIFPWFFWSCLPGRVLFCATLQVIKPAGHGKPLDGMWNKPTLTWRKNSVEKFHHILATKSFTIFWCTATGQIFETHGTVMTHFSWFHSSPTRLRSSSWGPKFTPHDSDRLSATQSFCFFFLMTQKKDRTSPLYHSPNPDFSMYSKLVNHLNPLVSHPKLDFINPHELVNIGYQLSPSKTA